MSTIKDLPVLPDGYDNTQTAYNSEKQKIKFPSHLFAFTNRWKAVWEIEYPNRSEITKAERELIDGTYDVEGAFKCFSIMIDGKSHCGHETPSCHSMHIMIPRVLMAAYFASEHFGVPTDIALLQLTGGIHQLMGEF